MAETAAVAAPAPAPSTATSSVPSSTSTSTPATTPAAATPSSQPAVAAPPTPTRQLTFREALDEIAIKGKEGKPKEEPKPAPAEPIAVQEPPKTVSEATKDEPAEPAAAAAEPPAPEEPFDPEKYQHEDLDPQAIADALKAIPDEKIRNRLKYDRRVAKLVTRPYGEQKELNQLFPTTEMARQASQYHAAYNNLYDAFTSGDPRGTNYVIAEMAKTNPQAFKGFVRQIAPHLQKIDPDAFMQTGTVALQNTINYMRQLSDREGDPDLKTAADLFEERILGKANQQQPRMAPQPHPAEQRLRVLEQRDMELREQARGNFLSHANGLVSQTLEKEASDLVAKSDPDNLYPEDAKAELRDEIRDATLAALNEDQRFGRYVHDLTINGQFDPDHVKRVVDAKLQAARMHLRELGPQRIEKYAKRFNLVQTNRIQRQSEIASRRDVGASGAVASAPPPKPIDSKGKSVRELLDFIPIRKRA
jgi:hypothetical protein